MSGQPFRAKERPPGQGRREPGWADGLGGGHSGWAAGRGHLALRQPSDALGRRVDLGPRHEPSRSPLPAHLQARGAATRQVLFSDPFTKTMQRTPVLRFTHLPRETAPEGACFSHHPTSESWGVRSTDEPSAGGGGLCSRPPGSICSGSQAPAASRAQTRSC